MMMMMTVMKEKAQPFNIYEIFASFRLTFKSFNFSMNIRWKIQNFIVIIIIVIVIVVVVIVDVIVVVAATKK